MYEVNVKFMKEDDKGRLKGFGEKILLKIEALEEVKKEVIDYYSSRGAVTTDTISIESITKRAYEVIRERGDGSIWFEVSNTYLIMDDGKETKSKTKFLILAADVDTAVEEANEYLKESVYDFVINGVKETKILDVI